VTRTEWFYCASAETRWRPGVIGGQSGQEPVFVDLLGAQESIPSMAGRYDKPIFRTGPPGYMAGVIDSSEPIPGLHKRLQIWSLGTST
jgi:hypothetical protein